MRIEPQTDGSWRIALAEAHTRATTETLVASAVQVLLHAVEQASTPDALAAMRADERHAVRQEEAIGRALGTIWTPVLAERLGQLRRDAQALIFAIEADGSTAHLPWELLSDPQGIGLESERLSLVRLGGSGGSASGVRRTVRVRHLTWTDDPLVAQTVQHIESTCISEEIDFKSIEIDRASTDSDSNVFEMLCLAAHGEALARLGLAADGRAAPTTASIVPTVDLALLLICDGDHALPNRMLSAGARACVAPAGRAGVEAAQTLAGTLIEQLHQGANVAAACAAARAAVRALAHPAPDMRWHRWRVHMSSLEPQVLCGLAAESAAHEAARRGGSGFVGLEHLILHPPPSFDAQLRYACRQSAPLVARHLALFEPPEHDAPMAETPRLAAGGPSTDAARQLLNALTGRSIHTPTVGGTTMGRSAPERRAAIGFEVLGGPEDGRVIRPADGETIGRYSAQPRADHLLYSAVGAWDPKTSRCHVRWLGGAVEIIAHAVVDGRPVEPGDRLPVQVGTIVQLGGVTRLVGWAPEPGA